MFHSARVQLTAWYLLIIMTISLLFSAAIYTQTNEEFIRFERMQESIRMDANRGSFGPGPGRELLLRQINDQTIEQARARFITALFFINFIIFVTAGGAGYFLAGRTLRPIKQMLDEQKRFISDSSHEFRTPLTSLRSEIEVALRSKNLKISGAKKILESNLEEVINLQILSDNLLELAQNGKLINKNSMETLSVKLVVQSAVEKLEPFAKKKQVKVASHIPSENLVFGIPDRLTEVFVILIDNAIKYAPRKSKVEINSKKTNGKIKISVTNHGMGISGKDLPHIFDRFYRGDESRSEDGYGLGLSIAKKIVESHSGSITAKSDRIETTFIITLPAS